MGAGVGAAAWQNRFSGSGWPGQKLLLLSPPRPHLLEQLLQLALQHSDGVSGVHMQEDGLQIMHRQGRRGLVDRRLAPGGGSA